MTYKQRFIAISVVSIFALLISILFIIPSRELPDGNESELARKLAEEIKISAREFGIGEVFFDAKRNVVSIDAYSHTADFDPKPCLSIPKTLFPEKLSCKKLVINCFNKREMRSEKRGNILVSEKIVTDPFLVIEISEGVGKCKPLM